jgi:hypothetical protein
VLTSNGLFGRPVLILYGRKRLYLCNAFLAQDTSVLSEKSVYKISQPFRG